MKHYKERDIEWLDEQGEHYSKHISAMTGEALHDKSDIAAELAWRDYEIDRLKTEKEALKQYFVAAEFREVDSIMEAPADHMKALGEEVAKRCKDLIADKEKAEADKESYRNTANTLAERVAVAEAKETL